MVMAEKRKNKKKKETDLKDLDKKPSKEEYAVARYLKQKLPEKKTTLLGHKVEYFIASRAVDCLLESPWAKEKKKGELYFPNRVAIVDFMAVLLEHKFFHRAKKIVVLKETKKKKKDTEEAAQESGKDKDSKKAKGKSDEKEGKEKEEKDAKKDGSETVEKKKEKKKIKLDMHLEQIFVDSNEPYVWIYDPIPLRTWITGTLMVIAAVLICLFPLWPQTIRHYIYYLSVAAAFLLVFIIGLAVFRLIVFVLIWILTFGKHNLWLLPNLTEDVGFFESFWPLYKYEYKGSKKENSKDKKHSNNDTVSVEEFQREQEKSDASSSDQDRKNDRNHSESEQEENGGDRQKGENDFEFVEVDEVSEDKTDDEKTDEDRKTK
ncbi:Translocation protein SEC62, partial [Stegodyphus mimosarum]